jgi:cytochrome c-type biogenesis protein CcmF
MPWLVSTAFLHSVMVQEKKDMLRVWNVILVALAFCLSLFGTFLTRSGVLNSIHSFTESTVGPWLLTFICVVALASVALIVSRLRVLRSRTKMESLVSREAAFLYNNLFLVAFALTVLWGVAWPLVSEAIRGVQTTVGAPYYDFFGIAFGLPLVLLMAIGPLIAWRRASLRSLGNQVWAPAAAALVVGVALAAAGAGSSAAGLVGYTFAAFVLAAIVVEFARGTRARKGLGDQTWLSAFGSLVARNRRRYGGYVVHAAIAILMIGAVGIGAFYTSENRTMAEGDSMVVGPYTLRLVDVVDRRAENREELRAQLAVTRDGKSLGTVEAGKNRYFAAAEQQPTTEVAIRTDWLRAEDLFVNGDKFYGNGTVHLKVRINPLVNLIWLGGFVFLLGSLVAMWPDAREQARLARRFAAAPA